MEQQTIIVPLFSVRPAYKFSRFILFLLIASGLFISSYLLYRYLNISAENSTGKIDFCSTVFATSCDDALTSKISTQLGLPLAAWSVLFYVGLLLVLLMPWFFGKTFNALASSLVYFFGLIVFIIAIVLVTTMIINPKLFCPLCTLIHIINIILFFLLPRTLDINFGLFRSRLKYLVRSFFSKKLFLAANLWKVFGLVTVLLLIASGYFGLKILTLSGAKAEPMFMDFKPILKEYKSQPVKNIPVFATDPSIGDDTSKIQVVVFSDFYCTGCKQFSYDLRNVIDSSKGEYHIVFKNYPLDKACNPLLQKSLHDGACAAALAAEAAHKQGKFWDFHDALFTADKKADEKLLQKTAMNLGLDLDQFNAWRNSDSARRQIQQDIYVASQLGIDATPAVFLNGRLVKDLRKGVLKLLINEEIKKSSFNIY